MKKIQFLAFFFLFTNFFANSQEVNYNTKEFQLSLTNKGTITHLTDKVHDTDYTVDGKKTTLISLLVKDSVLHPKKALFSHHNNSITFDFDHHITAEVAVAVKKTYITFHLISVSNESDVSAIIWGPYETSIRKSIGETIGIVQNDTYTIGLQALNVKTLGGYPWSDDDHLPQIDIFSNDDYDNMKSPKNRNVLYSVEAAKPTATGSSLEAYTRNRSKERIIANWGHSKFVAPAYQDGGLTGSGIALFGCISDSTLETIGQIEIGEGLPHPMIDGIWAKKSRAINSSYLIMNFSENNIDLAIDITQKAGFNYLYHSEPFETWGHYTLNPAYFPNGIDGLKNCVNKALQKGIRIGTHTLTNFINTNDAYVFPVPDKRLALVGSSRIRETIDSSQTNIELENPDYFNQFKNDNLRSILIDEEIIRYGSISDQAPWILKDCQRGSFGTHATHHIKGTSIGKLLDHGYKVFLGNASLNKEIAENIADVFNETGIRMLDFDGLEGAGSTGMGNYGEVLFAKAWYDHLNDTIKRHYLLGASRPGHYFWHIYSRMNWGEPWYAGFRESQTEYRLANQVYFKRNLMPGMLGWFKMTSSTTIEDIEWLMARSAGFNAGFAFVTDFKSIQLNGNSEAILSTMKLWEQARLKGLFNKEQETQMQDVNTEFHLEKRNIHELNLSTVYSYKFKHLKKDRQPGEPHYSLFDFENKANEQVMNFIITALGDDISGIEVEINHYKKTLIPVELKDGQTLKYTNGNKAQVYDKNWNKISEVTIDPFYFTVKKGVQSMSFDCKFSNTESEAQAKIEIRLKGQGETIAVSQDL